MATNDENNDWRAGWHAGMAAAAEECRRIARFGGPDNDDNDDRKIGALEAALGILQLKASADDAGT